MSRGPHSMDDMFLNASAFNGNISGWNTISLTTMEEMFMNANSFTGGDDGLEYEQCDDDEATS